MSAPASASAPVPRKRRQSMGEKAVDAIHRVEKKIEKALTVHWDELPTWLQDNHFIVRGYRPQSFSFRRSFHSLTYLHNESINIYTHLLGAVGLLLTGFYLHHAIAPRYASATLADKLVIGTFFAGESSCLAMSSFYHTISNHSPEVARFGNQLDYLGIVLAIFGSMVPSVYYGFFCHERLMVFYWLLLGSIGTLVAIATFNPLFRTPKYRPFRASLFISMGVSGVIPVIHAFFIYSDWQHLDDRMGLRWMLLQGALYVIGAMIYAGRVPERWAPGRFDLVGASHQVFHCFVVAAAVSHMYGLVVAFDWAHSRSGDVCTTGAW